MLHLLWTYWQNTHQLNCILHILLIPFTRSHRTLLIWYTLFDTLYYYLLLITIIVLHNFSNFCTFVSSCTRYYSLAFVPPRSTINAYRYSFCKYSNKIPLHILSVNDVDRFCSALRTYFLVLSVVDCNFYFYSLIASCIVTILFV